MCHLFSISPGLSGHSLLIPWTLWRNHCNAQKHKLQKITGTNNHAYFWLLFISVEVILYSPQFRSHQETKMAVIQTHWYLFVPLSFVAMLEF